MTADSPREREDATARPGKAGDRSYSPFESRLYKQSRPDLFDERERGGRQFFPGRRGLWMRRLRTVMAIAIVAGLAVWAVPLVFEDFDEGWLEGLVPSREDVGLGGVDDGPSEAGQNGAPDGQGSDRAPEELAALPPAQVTEAPLAPPLQPERLRSNVTGPDSEAAPRVPVVEVEEAPLAAAVPASPPEAPAAGTPGVAQVDASEEADTAAGGDAFGEKGLGVSVPRPRPEDAEPVRDRTTAAVPPQSPPPPAEPPSPAPEPRTLYSVQLAAMPTSDGAWAVWERLQARHADVIGSLRADVEAISPGRERTLYRLLTGPFASRESATKLCGALRQRRIDCFVFGAKE